MVHTAVAYARMKNALGTFACTSSTGPAQPTMVTGAALETINRLPVASAAGRVSRGTADPVSSNSRAVRGDSSVNDCFRPVSRYFDRLPVTQQ